MSKGTHTDYSQSVIFKSFPVAQTIKNLPAMWETRVFKKHKALWSPMLTVGV